MRQGMRGERVRYLQNILSRAGMYAGRIDGEYGPLTSLAVKDYQRHRGLKPDQWAGPVTQLDLERELRRYNTDETLATDPVVPRWGGYGRGSR